MNSSPPSLFRMASNRNMRCAQTEYAYGVSRVLGPHDLYSSNLSEPIPVRVQSIRWEWQDFLTPKNSLSPLLCSERVFRAMQEAKLTGYKGVAVKLRPPPRKRIAPPYKYFWVIPIAPPFKMGKKVYVGSRHTHQYRLAFESDNPKDPGFKEIVVGEKESACLKNIPLLHTWDGSDFNRFTEDQPTNIMGSMFCSRRVLDLAAREKWTNIQFAPVDALEPVSIDFLKGPWPPLAWYSKYEPE